MDKSDGHIIDEWRCYFREWINRQSDAGELPDRVARYERLLSDRTLDEDWIKLAKDVRPYGEPPSCDPCEVLFEVARAAVGFLPNIIQSPTREQVQPVLRALRILDRAWHDSPNIADHLSAAIGEATGRPIPLPTSRADVKELMDSIERIDWGQYRGPLMPATFKGKTASRNWLALYLRDVIIPGFFGKRHDAAIGKFISVAYPEWPDFEDGAKSVRELRERSRGTERWGELLNGQVAHTSAKKER